MEPNLVGLLRGIETIENNWKIESTMKKINSATAARANGPTGRLSNNDLSWECKVDFQIMASQRPFYQKIIRNNHILAILPFIYFRIYRK